MSDLAVIRARRAEIAQELARLKAEDDELAVVEQVLKRLAGAGAPGVVVAVNSAAQPSRGRLLAPRSQREYVLDALATSERPWLRSHEIIAHVQKRWGVVISERSLRPLLSVMKRDNQIVRNGRMLALPERAETVLKRAPR